MSPSRYVALALTLFGVAGAGVAWVGARRGRRSSNGRKMAWKWWTGPLVNPELRALTTVDPDARVLDGHVAVLARKPILREIYQDWYGRLHRWLPPGRIIEVGAGTGNFARWLAPRRVFTIDMLRSPVLDLQADGGRLPIRTSTVNAVVMFDALHHADDPMAFLQEAARVLVERGRLILVEPLASPWGRLVYGGFHHERVAFDSTGPVRHSGAWEGAAGVSRWLIEESAAHRLPLNLIATEFGDVLAYPLSGGLSYRSLLPVWALRKLHAWERHPLARKRSTALRVLAVLEKPAASTSTPSTGHRAPSYLRGLVAGYVAGILPAHARTLELAPHDPVPDWDALADRGLDAVVLHDVPQAYPDAQNLLAGVWKACDASSRLVLVHYGGFWQLVIRLVTVLKGQPNGRLGQGTSPADVESLLRLGRFELVSTQQRVLIPIRIPLCDWINKWVGPLPLLRFLCVANVAVARPLKRAREELSVSVIVPARNEAGTIDALVRRLPKMGPDDELIFVEGQSTDGTWDAIQRAIAAKGAGSRMRGVRQPGVGKADAVRHGFELATKDLLMILDADLTVPPEELPVFYRAIASDAAEFINGNRLIYAMDPGAMRSVNVVGNKFFARALSYLLGQPIGDALCGTKVLRRTDYDRLRRRQVADGHADPFGDFELLFGAAALGLKIAEVPVHYRRRVYGTTKIRRWRHGCTLLRMTLGSAGRVKFG